MILKFVYDHKRSQIAKAILSTDNKGKRHHAPWFQTILQNYSNPNSMDYYKTKHKDHWKRIESLEMKSHLHGQWLYNKKDKTTQ